MARRKGLFHLVEIVIITLIMFVMISQTSRIPGTDVDWTGPRLMTLGRDVLFSLEEMGADWSDEGSVRDYLNYTFGSTRVQYSLEYRGVPQESISVGCLCDGSVGCTNFCDWLDSELSGMGPLSFNNFSVDFSVTDTESINNLFDVIVTDQGLGGMRESVRSYLAAGRGFVLVRDLDQPEFNSYGGTLREFFAADNGSGTGSGPVEFNTFEAEEYPGYYGIITYFSAIPNGTGGTYNVSHEFGPFSADSARKVASPDGRVVLETSSGHPAGIAKSSATGSSGRTAWLSDSSSRDDDWSVYLASLVVWSSERTRQVAGGDMSRAAATVSLYSVPDDTSRPDYVFQPLEVVLSMGYLYS